MFKSIFSCIALAAILTMQAGAVDVRAGVSVGTGDRYHHYDNWTEGTVSAVGKDGRLTIRGTASPYASEYVKYHSGYYTTPESGRVTYSTGYRDRFGYKWDDSKLTEYTYTVPETVTVYEEPNYGREFTTWTYSNEPRRYKYSDLKAGDRIVVGHDRVGLQARTMFRVTTK